MMDLSVSFGGLTLANPLMPASGPLVGDDRKMLALACAGLGAIVSKTISVAGAEIPRPCIIGGRDWIMNAELWSEYGPERWAEEFLPRVKAELLAPLFVSVGYTAHDMEYLIPLLDPFADAFEVSTHYLGKSLEPIAETVRTIRARTAKPFFMKMSPHLTDPASFARMALENGATGVAATNSLGPTVSIDIATRSLRMGNTAGEVWLSGPPIKPIALAIVRRIREALPECPIIGAGGVASATDVVEFLLAGADAVQMLSAAMIRGRDLYGKILAELPAVLESAGFPSVRAVRETGLSPAPVRERPGVPVFDHDRCTRCGLCERICPWLAISTEAGKMTADPQECFGCGLCQSRCPVSAISGVYGENGETDPTDE